MECQIGTQLSSFFIIEQLDTREPSMDQDYKNKLSVHTEYNCNICCTSYIAVVKSATTVVTVCPRYNSKSYQS